MDTQTALQQTIARKLSTLAIEYGTPQTREQLALLAVDWAQELAAESPETVAACLDQHRRECSRFPTLAHVIALLPRCRVAPQREALPEAAPAENWGNRAADIRKALRGDAAARARMDALTASVLQSCAMGVMQ